MSLSLPSIEKAETLRERIVGALREEIVGGVLRPGAQLVESRLADQLNVSRGPVREAIRQLVEEGLLESIAYRGTFVRTLTVRDVEEIYSFRSALDKFAFRITWEKRDDRFFTELDRRHDALMRAIRHDETSEAVARELDLHSLVYEWSEHALLQSTWHDLRGIVHFCLALHHQAHRALLAAHEEYVNVARGSSRQEMNRAIDRHLKAGLQRIRGYVEQQERQLVTNA